MRTIRHTIGMVLFAVIAAAGSGCASNRESVSVKVWQGDLQKYVNSTANGDMNSLRSTQATTDRPGFRVFSNDRAEDSSDIVGVLVGATRVGDHLWYLYLVGENKKELLQDMFAVAVSQQALKYHWREGPHDPAALAAYRAHLDKTWREAHPDHAQPPRGAMAFPSSTDAFEYTARGDMITIREKTSGAEWNVDLVKSEPK